MSFDLKVTINTSMAQGTLGYLKKMVGEFGSITATKFTGMFAAAAVAKMAFDKVTASMEKNMQMAKQISGLSSKFHIDPKEVHSLLLAANDAGVSVRSLLMGMKQLGALAGRALVDKNSMGVFKQLGMDVEKVGDIAEKPVKQFAEIARQLMQIDNETDRAAYGTKMLGRQYQQMLPLIEKLGTSAEARANFLESEHAMTKEQVEQQKMVAKMQSEMGDAWDRIVANLSPVILSLTAMVSLLMDGANWLGKWVELTKLFGGMTAHDKKQEVERNIAVGRRYEMEKKMAMDAKARLMEANSRVAGSGLRSMALGDIAGMNELQVSEQERQSPGMRAKYDAVRYTGIGEDYRRLQSFEQAYAQTQTQFGPDGSVVEGTYSHGDNGPSTLAKPASMIQREKIEKELAAKEEEAKDSFFYKTMLRGRASGSVIGALAETGGQGGPAGVAGRMILGKGTELLGSMMGGGSLEDDIEFKKKELEQLREKGSLDEMAYNLQKEALDSLEDERRAKVKYMETFLKVAGMNLTNYIDKNGNIIAGKKPTDGYLRPVEDVDAVKKEEARTKSKRALERKVAREMTDHGGATAAAKFEVGLTEKEKTEHLVEDYEPKKKAMEDADRLLKAATAERAAYLEKYGVVQPGETIKDKDGNLVKSIKKGETRYDEETGRTIKLEDEYAGIAKGFESAKSGFETAEKDFDKEENRRVDMANAVYKAERALWQALQNDKMDAIAEEDDAQQRMHNRKTKMMELEGKDRREILEENFKFEVAKLEDALVEQTDMQRQALDDGNITAEEEKALDEAQVKVDAQASKAEGAMFALAAANKPWQVASDMRAVGGGGKVIGTSGNVAIDQLEVLKDNLPASKQYLATIADLLGKGQNASGDVTTRTSGATYAPAKGTTAAKPGK